MLLPFIGAPVIRGLEIGVFEGRSCSWWLENVLTGPGSSLVAVDPHRRRFINNLEVLQSLYPGKLQFYAMRAEDYLRSCNIHFDFIYIDGGKRAESVLEQTVLAWPRLKPGGILIWDDYKWPSEKKRASTKDKRFDNPPSTAINAFLSVHQSNIEVIHKAWQLIARKRNALDA